MKLERFACDWVVFPVNKYTGTYARETGIELQ